jgi:Ca-activated chloride channel family protein
VPLTAAGAAPREVDPLRYQTQAITEAAGSDELVTIKLRYKRPDSDVSQLLSRAVHDAAVSGEASRDLRWAAAVAGFGMLLRNSEHKGQASLAQVDALARNALGSDPEGQRHEFVSLIEQARMLGVQSTGPSARRSRVARP